MTSSFILRFLFVLGPNTLTIHLLGRVQVDGNRNMDTVFEDITKIVEAALAKSDPLEAFCQSAPEADECR